MKILLILKLTVLHFDLLVIVSFHIQSAGSKRAKKTTKQLSEIDMSVYALKDNEYEFSHTVRHFINILSSD